MSFVPTAKIYEDDGVSLVYNIGNMLKNHTTGWPDYENPFSVSLESNRSVGSIIIPGGSKSTEILIGGRLTAGSYSALITAFEALKAAITTNTHFYLKIDTSDSTTDSIKVVRTKKIEIINTNWVSWMYLRIPFMTSTWSS